MNNPCARECNALDSGCFPESYFVDSIVYIDPSAKERGHGTKECPFNTWDGVVGYSSNVAYLQKAGTTYRGKIEPYGRSNGSLSEPYYFGAYGSGPKPKIIGTEGNSCIHFNNCSGGMVVENLELHGTDIYGVNIALNSSYNPDSANGFVLRNCDFHMKSTRTESGNWPKPFDVKAICVYMPSGKQINNITIENCNFYSESLYRDTTDKFNHIYVYQHDEPFQNLTIRGCEFNEIYGSAVRVFVAIPTGQTVLDKHEYEAIQPSGFIIENNVFKNIANDVLQLHTGVKSTTQHPTRINSNTVLCNGDWGINNINSFQLTYAKDVEVAYNRIETVKTGRPDGAGIILDWIQTNDGKILLSDGCLIHHNIISGCNSGVAKMENNAPYSSGIDIFRAKECLVYANWIYNCSTGISLTGAVSTDALSSGNKLFNNTIMQCVLGFRLGSDPIDNTEVFNNLLLYNTVGLRVRTPSSVLLDITNNVLCGNYILYEDGNSHIVSEANIITTDVLAVDPCSPENGWVLLPGPPCFEAGRPLPDDSRINIYTFGLNNTPVNTPPTIGAWQFDPVTPFNLEDTGHFTTAQGLRDMADKDG